jgi:hypothetical protein
MAAIIDATQGKVRVTDFARRQRRRRALNSSPCRSPE